MPFLPDPHRDVSRVWKFLRYLNEHGAFADDGGRAPPHKEHDRMSGADPAATPPPTPPATDHGAGGEPGSSSVNDDAADAFASEWQSMQDGLRNAIDGLTEHLTVHHDGTFRALTSGRGDAASNPGTAAPPSAPTVTTPKTPDKAPEPLHWWWRPIRRKGGK